MQRSLRSSCYLALAGALLAGCAAMPGASPTVPAGGVVSQSAVQRASDDDYALKRHFRLILPLQAEFVRTGVMLWSSSSICANQPVPKKLKERGFPLDAAALLPPRSAMVRVAIAAIQACSQTAHQPNPKSTVVPMNVATPSPVPTATPSFGADGYYVVALAADPSGRISVLDVSGPLDKPADGPFPFPDGIVQLSTDSSYAFYLAKERATPNGGDEDDEAF